MENQQGEIISSVKINRNRKCEICGKRASANTGAINHNPLRKRICQTCEWLVINRALFTNPEALKKVIEYNKYSYVKYRDITEEELYYKVLGFQIKDDETEWYNEGVEIARRNLPESLIG